MNIKRKKRRKKSIEDWILDIIIYSILIFLAFICFYPLGYVVVASFSSSRYIASQGAFLVWPEEFSLKAYEFAFQDADIMRGFKNSILIEILSLPINIVLTMLCGYFLASTGMKLKKPIVAYIMFTMFFSGGLVPAYLNIKSLGLYDSIWALVLPGALSVYNAIICKTAIEGIPESLPESAFIDGASDWQILWKIILPLIKPTAAVLVLYYGVTHWNAWFNASIYLKSTSDLKPAQLVLRYIMIKGGTIEDVTGGGDAEFSLYADTIQYAAIVIITIPILCVYPFLQKHFAKGVMIGAVKG